MKKILFLSLLLIVTGVYAQDMECSCTECVCEDCPAMVAVDEMAVDEYTEIEVVEEVEKVRLKPKSYFGFDFGFIGLAGDHGVMEIRTGHSIDVSLTLGTKFWLNQNKSLSLTAGLRPRWDNYVFDENMTLAHDGTAIAIDPTFKKSKLTTVSLDLPVMFNIKTCRHLTLSAGGYGGVLLGSHTKVKFPKHKDHDDFGLNTWQAGATVRAQLTKLKMGVFATYSFTPLFKNGDARPFMVGICL